MINALDILIYRSGVMMPEPHTVELPESPGFAHLNDAIGELIGIGNHIEHVSVLFRGEPHDMFVDEFGALPVHDVGHGRKARLPVNEAATLIYHEASRQRGDDMTDAPKIHGPAVVTMRRVWF